MISTSSSESISFLFNVDETGSVVVAGAVEDGASTSTTAGSSELESNNRGRGGGCRGLERAEDGAIDGFDDLDLCEWTVEAGDGLRERVADR